MSSELSLCLKTLIKSLEIEIFSQNIDHFQPVRWNLQNIMIRSHLCFVILFVCLLLFRKLEVFANIPVAQVSCGSQHSVALTRGAVKFIIL